ncbi:hypothetical protein HD806DRAFT_552568 [Xylariaceae sp. AK1471]|nr:hypothetical protein HD806DRAFT_552568 [Xylariaceae sp. AK1471]
MEDHADPLYLTESESIALFKQVQPSVNDAFGKLIPRPAQPTPELADNPVVKSTIKIVGFYVRQTGRIQMVRRIEPWHVGYIPLVTIRLCDGFLDFKSKDYDPAQWKACLKILRKTFAPQFCLLVRAGKAGSGLWALPKAVWLPGDPTTNELHPYDPKDRAAIQAWYREEHGGGIASCRGKTTHDRGKAVLIPHDDPETSTDDDIVPSQEDIVV